MQKGAPNDVQSAVFATPLKRSFRVVFSSDGIIASDWLDADRRGSSARSPRGGTFIAAVEYQISEYFARRLTCFELPLIFTGTEFMQAVWRAAGQIPFGATASYGDVARAAGYPGAHRGVARAMGQSPFALFMPAQRVVGSDGRVRGAALGSMRLRLLAFEQGHEEER